MGNTPIENRPGGPGDLSDLWPILAKVYGTILAVVLLLCFLLWLVNRYQQKCKNQEQAQSYCLFRAVREEAEWEDAEAKKDLWFTDPERHKELYCDFSDN
jgi:hypothetical protein